VVKCCKQYQQADGRFPPACVRNNVLWPPTSGESRWSTSAGRQVRSGYVFQGGGHHHLNANVAVAEPNDFGDDLGLAGGNGWVGPVLQDYDLTCKARRMLDQQ
jgi:hypothetical protein